MVCVILNLAENIFVCDHDEVDLSLFPVFLNLCDNMSSTTWVNKNCKYSLIGRRLARFFVGLLMGTNIAIQAEWLSTHEILLRMTFRVSKIKTEMEILITNN